MESEFALAYARSTWLLSTSWDHVWQQAMCTASQGVSARHAVTSVLLQVTGAQHDPTGPPQAIRDESKVWETIAAAQYKLDDDDAGWESDVSDEETADDKYIRVRADDTQQAYHASSCFAMLPACVLFCAP